MLGSRSAALHSREHQTLLPLWALTPEHHPGVAEKPPCSLPKYTHHPDICVGRKDVDSGQSAALLLSPGQADRNPSKTHPSCSCWSPEIHFYKRWNQHSCAIAVDIVKFGQAKQTADRKQFALTFYAETCTKKKSTCRARISWSPRCVADQTLAPDKKRQTTYSAREKAVKTSDLAGQCLAPCFLVERGSKLAVEESQQEWSVCAVFFHPVRQIRVGMARLTTMSCRARIGSPGLWT